MNDALVVNGVPWFDDRGLPVNAHGGCVVREGDVYYLFGEYKTDDENKFIGFGCYSSRDLAAWTWEGLALAPQGVGLLGPERIGERPKVLRSPTTGSYVMLMHTDDLGYTDPTIGVAVSEAITGPYEFQGPLLVDGEPLRAWDMGTFHDDDGVAYLLLHEGDIYRLDDTMTAAREKVAREVSPGGESPAMAKVDGTYVLMFSRKTSWERNDNYYFTAPSPRGPWAFGGLVAPPGTLTHNSQCTYLARVEIAGADTLLYMGDRWSFPRQASAATYVWMPLTTGTAGLGLGLFVPSWDPATGLARNIEGTRRSVSFRSAVPGESFETLVEGSRVTLEGVSDRHSGYARVELFTADGATLLASHLVDFYSLVEDAGYRYRSPVLPDHRTLVRVTVTGEYPVWFKKNGERFGSDNCFVTVSAVVSEPR
ncbi:family 43 glycosylhydrolase [Demequina sp. NBRC 110055]|uniref:family 43 glycosylhydrolase n=1 Tax=Demequina sp. NBRC 110055 TaxID=1570344 RepID=UPI0009FF2D5D|nr:family 43 glycosylhydrolase [Demequina sp. NBRC 110055]